MPTAEDVDGWSVSSTQDDQGRTVVEWTGGSLPPDQPGAFPIEFVAPDAVGELLTFPAVQTCANGEELPWISGDPASEFPAPRLLILAPGSQPAATIDDVPLDAPGRDQIIAVVDVDNPARDDPAPSSHIGRSHVCGPDRARLDWSRLDGFRLHWPGHDSSTSHHRTGDHRAGVHRHRRHHTRARHEHE